ncbi:hypothetical protein Q8F55_008261 [Vanrija albida]|uniref:Uncharacterized protein n=1 Tax=Vanrija albida TaxID=181172 RepID=A0ABR3PVU0_9TREE
MDPPRPTHRLFSRSLSALDGYAADDQPPRLRRRSTVMVQSKLREWPRSAKWAVKLQTRRLSMPARYRSGTRRATNKLRELPSSTKRMLRRVFKGSVVDENTPLL